MLVFWPVLVSNKDLARTVLALRKLVMNPQAHGIQPQKLQNEDFRQRYREREKAIETVVKESYRQLWYPSAGGQIVFKEIRTADGESGMAVLEQIRKTLVEDGELITPERVSFWLSRITTYGDAANRWALTGMKVVLEGQPGDKAVGQMLEGLGRIEVLKSCFYLQPLKLKKLLDKRGGLHNIDINNTCHASPLEAQPGGFFYVRKHKPFPETVSQP